MTCIVGIVDQGCVFMGGDSASVGGLDLRIERQPKVFRKGDMLIGATGSWRTLQLLRYKLTVPDHVTERTEDHAWLVSDLAESIRECLKNGGLDRKNDGEEQQNSHILIGYRGALYTVQVDYAVLHHVEPYEAVGCGVDYALGSFHATEGKKPRERILAALEAAAHFSAGVTPPFVVEELG